MAKLSSKDIGVPFIIGLMFNLISGYLFTIQKISFTIFIFILTGSLIIIIIIAVQLKTNEAEDELIELKEKVKSLEEKLIIYERLIRIEEKLNNLEKENKYGKK